MKFEVARNSDVEVKKKSKLAIFDLDGTLFDTKEVNYLAYKEAIGKFGYRIDFMYFKDFCNGRYYLDFLPSITTDDMNILRQMHEIKQRVYCKYVGKAKVNTWLFDLIMVLKQEYYIALVTTASKENTYEILDAFGKTDVFDLIISRENVKKSKPDPEGFFLAMKKFDISSKNTIVFEDSDVGIEAAEQTGAGVMAVKGFN